MSKNHSPLTSEVCQGSIPGSSYQVMESHKQPSKEFLTAETKQNKKLLEKEAHRERCNSRNTGPCTHSSIQHVTLKKEKQRGQSLL